VEQQVQGDIIFNHVIFVADAIYKQRKIGIFVKR